jgi:outer membrane lipoprotein-sorting protein
MFRSTLAVATLVAMFASFVTFVGAAPEDKGHEIAAEADRLDRGFSDHRADITMTLRNPRGESSERLLRTYTLEGVPEGDKTLVVFEAPKDIAGTALLTHSRPEGNDDQWLYLPALGRVKRISSGNRSGPFVGSEFAYEDLSSPELNKYSYSYKGEDGCDGEGCWIVERVPKDPKSGYVRQVAWIDKQAHRYRRVDFYDRKNTLLKTLTLSDYKQYLNYYWRPGRAEMHNHQTGKSTTLQWQGYVFKSGLTERDFDRGSLERLAR